ncbi:MAG: hypothetical protein AAF623_01870 [Planctomycetota bacterium]
MADQMNVVDFSIEGDRIGESHTDTIQVDQEISSYFDQRFRHLSGDLELPFEDSVPGEVNHLEYRIGSDLRGAYVLFYYHDEVIFSSLLLSGNDEQKESELMQVFKFLLLDTEDEEEPTEEMIDSVLSSSLFDFESYQDRPAIFQVNLSRNPEDEKVCQHLAKVNLALAAAFFKRSNQISS